MKSSLKISAALTLILCGTVSVWAQSLPSTAPSSAGKDIATATVTVKELIQIDNDQALRKAREEAGRSGLFTGVDQGKPVQTTQAAPKPAAPRIELFAIYGESSALKASMSINDILVDGLAAGNKIGQCTIYSIDVASGCVSLRAPVAQSKDAKSKTGSKKTKAKAKTTDPKGCAPKICWTGEQLAEKIRPSQAVSQSVGAGLSAPVPLPLPPGGVTLGARGTPGGGYMPAPMR